MGSARFTGCWKRRTRVAAAGWRAAVSRRRACTGQVSCALAGMGLRQVMAINPAPAKELKGIEPGATAGTDPAAGPYESAAVRLCLPRRTWRRCGA